MSNFAALVDRVKAALDDQEYQRLAPFLSTTLGLLSNGSRLTLRIENGVFTVSDASEAKIEISAQDDAWAKMLTSPAVATYHSFTALQIANEEFEIRGDAQEIAMARPILERLIERITAVPPTPAKPVKRSLDQISGRYKSLKVNGKSFDFYFETTGEGTPVLFLHTAGADGRQFRAQMSDIELARRHKLFAVDLPFHGKSLPPHDWDGSPYLLTSDLYRDWCSAFIEQVIGKPAIIVGGSMGAAMALVMAAERPGLVKGIVALEPPFQSRGRRNPFQNHIGVHGGLHNGAFVRGLMSPTSPISDRRVASWIYSQGGPGVYPGDLAFYSDEFNGAVIAPQIDAKRTPVALLSGTYDYSATPADGAKLAALISGSLHIVMEGLGHFPMTEHPDYFRTYLMQGLEHIEA